MALSRDSILKHAGVQDRKTVHVPAWRDDAGDDEVVVRGMTVREFEVNQATLGDKSGTAMAALIARCVLDGNGARIFGDNDVKQIAELGFAQVNELAQAISELSGLNDKQQPDEDAAGKDSPETTGDSSSSVSPATSPAPSPSSPTV